jgi:signal recognition particle receptor subunit beta
VLVVLGEFNHGKTTFVNALLGGPVLPTGITPTTAVIHEVRHGEAARDGGASGRRPPGGWASSTRCALFGRARVPSRAQRPRRRQRIDPDDVLRVELEYPAEILRDRVTLVDTPGVNDLNLQRAEITYGYVPRADAVVFLLDAGQILKESERRFLRDRLLGAGRDRIVFAINKADLLSERERTEVMEYATRQLEHARAGRPVMFLSADAGPRGRRAGSGSTPCSASSRPCWAATGCACWSTTPPTRACA